MILRVLSALWTSVAPQMANHLWQSTFFVALAAVLAFELRKNQARVRYWIWLTASVKFLIPFSLLIAFGSHLAKPRVSTPAQIVVYSAVEDWSQPFAGQEAPSIYQAAASPARMSPLHWLPPIVVALWLAGIVVVVVMRVKSWTRVSLLVRRAVPLEGGPEVEALRRLESSLGAGKPIKVVLSQDWMEPGIFGVFRPVLIWPEGISQHLNDRHVEAIVAHEICHARRRDNLTAVLHMLVEAVFWFHPLVWWMGARLEEERERACDEEVSLLCNQPHVYAESILRVCKFCSESPLACVSGITGADLKKRIVQIMTERVVRKLDLGRKLLLLAVGLVVVAAPIVLGQVKAAQRMMLAAVNAAPKPVQAAAHAMMVEEKALSSIEAADASQAAAPPTTPSADDMSLGPEFEVATIRPSDPSAKDGGGRVTASGRFEGRTMTLANLVSFAYTHWQSFGAEQVASEGPVWTRTERYDVEAKLSDAEMIGWGKLPYNQRVERMRPALRRLLADRFHLQVRTEQRVTQVYALVIAKGGSKLKEAAQPLPMDGSDAEMRQSAQDAMAHNTVLPGSFMMSGDSWKGNSLPLGTLAMEIAANAHLDAPLVNLTGLNGYYDFTMKASYEKDGPLLVDQVEQQLGLKVQPRKMPLTYYIITSAEKPSVDGAEVVPAAMMQEKDGAASVGDSPQPAAFDVASIHRDPATAGSYFRYLPGGRLSASSWIKQVIQLAYGMKDYQVTGGPGWLTTDWYDIEAKAPNPDATKDDINAMTQTLLADRFKLRSHTTTQEFDVYDLVVDKNGPRLTPLKEGEASKCGRDNSAWCGTTSTAQLAEGLKYWMGRPVFDKTGTSGRYDILLDFDVYSARGKTPPEGYDKPSLTTALHDQLGLKLVPHKESMPVMVIDSIERPTDN